MASVSQEVALAMGKILQFSLDQTLRASAPDTQWNFRPADSLQAIQHQHCIVLTISSFKFRIMCLLHLTMDRTTRQFVADACGTKVDDLDEASYLDYLLEMSNGFCGHVKRMLQSTCPPLGMSTPNLLDRSCLLLDNVLEANHSTHCAAYQDYSETPLFAVSAFVSARNPQDFVTPNVREIEAEAEVDSSGELELF